MPFSLSARLLRIRLPLCVLVSVFLSGPTAPVRAQNQQKIQAQKRVIEELERKIADGEREISKLRSGRSATQERVERLSRQIESRDRLLEATEQEAGRLHDELEQADSTGKALAARLDRNRRQYADMVREAWRNYRHRTALTYLISAEDFTEMARRIVNLRELAHVRERKMRQIAEMEVEVQEQKEQLAMRRHALDSVSRKVSGQRRSLAQDAEAARRALKQLSQKERSALQRKIASEEALNVAIAELRKLTKGNTAGASFSSKTRGLRLPVEGGKVKRYKENMAEVTGPRGAAAIAIYEGKVMEVKRNRITDKYEIYIAHGAYITTYSNLSSISVAKGDCIARNARLGIIGPALDLETMQTEYKLVFGIYPPNPKQRMLASECFKK